MKLPAWLEQLVGASRPVQAPKPRPPGWSKTIADLLAEKRSLSGEETEWARQYEREQLRAWARFPKDGEEFEALHDLNITYLIHWRAPFTGGGEGIMPMGARLRVSVNAADPEPVGVYATAIEVELMEQRLVPEADRLASEYDGYSLFLSVSQLNKEFRLVQPHEKPIRRHHGGSTA